MKTEYIQKLLDAYYNGETSKEEEDILFNYFHSDEVVPELEDEKIVFLQLQNSSEEIFVDPKLEYKLEELITDLDIREKQEIESLPTFVKKKRHLLFWVVGAAACITILFSVGFFLIDRKDTEQPNIIAKTELKDTFSDPNKAYVEAEKALLLVSKNLNKGLDQLAFAQENINKSNEIVNRSLNQITTN